MKVIDPKNLPVRWNIWTPIILYLFLEKINAPGWAYGVFFTMLAGVYGIAFYLQSKEEKTDIFK